MLRSTFLLLVGAAAGASLSIMPVMAGEPQPRAFQQTEPTGPTPGDFVAVQLRDGRRVAGWVVPAVRPERLSVRVGGPGLCLTSHFSWTLVESLAIVPPPPQVALPGPVRPPARLPVMPPPPRTIRLHAEPVNTDGDVAADSLRVVVLPLDERRRPMVAGGQLNVSLTDATGGAITDRGPRFRADWSRDLRPSDMTPDGYVVDLPLRTPLPMSSVARPLVFQVDASLSVPGAGRLEATQTLLPHVPPSLGILRDRLVTP